MRDAFVSYYAKEYLPVVKEAYRELYDGIKKYSEDYYKEHQEYPDYSSEDEKHIVILENLLLPEIRNHKKIEKQLESLKDIQNQKKNLLKSAQELNEQKEYNKNAENSLKRGKIFMTAFWVIELMSLVTIITYLILM